MKNTYKVIFLYILSSTFVSSLFSCLPERKKTSSENISLVETASVKWKNSLLEGEGINIKISNDFISDFSDEDFDQRNYNPLEQMLSQWNQQVTSKTFFKLPASSTQNKNYSGLEAYKDEEMGIYKSYEWFGELKESVLAVTQYYGHYEKEDEESYIRITHADIILNYRDHEFSTDSSDSSAYDLPSVVLHELGHFLGLGHTSNSINSVMNPSFGRYDSKRSPTDYDHSAISQLYGEESSLSSLVESEDNTLDSSTSPSPRFSTKTAAAIKNSKSSSEEISLPSSAREREDGQIHGLIELSADGICRHSINGHKIFEHHIGHFKKGVSPH